MTDAKETTSSVSEANRFYGHKERYTYYVISLPFAFAGMAIMSYPYAAQTSAPALIVTMELLAWILFLLAGHNGLRQKEGEMEQARLRAMQQEAGELSPCALGDTHAAAFAKIKLRREERIVKAEGDEAIGRKRMKSLMWYALLCWVLSRAGLALACCVHK